VGLSKLDVLEEKNLLLLAGIQTQVIQPQTKKSWLYCIILLF